MKQFIKSIGFCWSDLFLALAIIFGTILCFEGTSLMGTIDPKQTIMPFGLLIAFFALAIVSLGVCLFLEFKIYKNHIHLIPLAIICLLMIIGLIVLFAQPYEIGLAYPNPNGDPFVINTTISYQVRLVYFFDYFLILCFFYLILFVIPERIKNPKFIIFATNAICVVGLAAILFSLITEFKNYGLFFINIFGSGDIQETATKSFLNHKNIFGALLEFSIFSAIIAYSLGKNKTNLIFIGIYYVFSFFTICKTAILISTFTIMIFIIYNILLKFKEDKSRLIKSVVIISSILLAMVVVGVICIITIPALRDKLFDNDTVVGREKIWEKGLFIAKDLLFVGRGYGLYNSLLLKVNALVLDDPTFSSHSMIVSILGRSGIVGLIAFITAVGFGIKLLIDEFKVDKESFACFALVLFGLIIHSIFEDHYYLVICLIALIQIVRYSRIKEEKLSKQIVLL